MSNLASQIWWDVARSGGIVAWALVAASVLLGLALSTKITNGRPRPNWLADLHRYLGGLAVIFTGIHVLGLVLDNYLSFGLSELLVPLASTYRPGPVALGVISLYFLLAVEVTSLLRKHLSRKVWRATHLLSFLVYFGSTAHGILAGTNAGSGPLFFAMVLTSIAVVGLTAARIDQALQSKTSKTRGGNSRIPVSRTT